MKTDYLDQVIFHYPYWWQNPREVVKEVFRGLSRLVEEGKVRSIGVSNFTIDNLKYSFPLTKLPICVNQFRFHPYFYQKRLLEFCKANNIVLTAYMPLSGGTKKFLSDPTLNKIGESHGKSAAQVILRWILQKGGAAVPKSTSPQHIQENFDLFDWELSSEDMQQIDNLGEIDPIADDGRGRYGRL